MTEDWKYIMNDKVRRHIHMYIGEEMLKQDTPRPKISVYYFWREKGPMILGEVEFLESEAEETGRKEALLELKQAIEADGNINNDSPNTGRILQLIDTFVAETEVEVDYSNDGEGEAVEEDS